MADLRDLKARANILDVLDRIGARTKMPESWDDEVPVWCPFCADAGSNKPAARANPLKGLYFCYACGFGGDVISVVRRYLERDGYGVWGTYSAFDVAVKWLEQYYPAEEEADDPWS